MMTGDSEKTAASVARRVGVDAYYSEVLPEDKAKFVEQERASGRTVIMIGDGINDSPALSAAMWELQFVTVRRSHRKLRISQFRQKLVGNRNVEKIK